MWAEVISTGSAVLLLLISHRLRVGFRTLALGVAGVTVAYAGEGGWKWFGVACAVWSAGDLLLIWRKRRRRMPELPTEAAQDDLP